MTDAVKGAVLDLLNYCDMIGLQVDMGLRARAIRAAKGKGDSMAQTNARYHSAITESLTSFFEGGNTTSAKNGMKSAMVEAFNTAFDLGWEAGGGSFPIEADALEWLNSRVAEEGTHIDSLFQQAKELRKDTEADFFAWITARADGYVAAVASVYNAAVMLAKGKQMLTWRLGKTERHCNSCLKLDGGRHKASWYLSRDYIPQKPGAAMDCGGYHCDCRLETDDGEVVTI